MTRDVGSDRVRILFGQEITGATFEIPLRIIIQLRDRRIGKGIYSL